MKSATMIYNQKDHKGRKHGLQKTLSAQVRENCWIENYVHGSIKGIMSYYYEDKLKWMVHIKNNHEAGSSTNWFGEKMIFPDEIHRITK